MATEYTHRLTAIVPVQDLEPARALAMYYDPDPASDGGFHTRYSATGAEPATHSVAHTVCTQILVDDLTAAQASDPPPALLDVLGLDAQALADLLGRMTIAVDADPHAVIAEVGLQPVAAPPE